MILRIIITTVSLLLNSSLCLAAWSGPQQVIVGSWGKNAGQFYWDSGDDINSFPHLFGVDKDGLVVIPDTLNRRIVIYNQDGTIKAVLTKPSDLSELDSSWGWPLSGFHLFPSGNSIIVNCNYKKIGGGRGPQNVCFLNYSGAITSKIDINGITDETTPVANGYIVVKKPQFLLYSPAGQLIQTFTTKPLELGIIDKIQAQPDGSSKLVVRYPERTFSINIPDQRPEQITRDSSGYLYAIQRFIEVLNTQTPDERNVQHYRVIRYSYCGKEMGRLDLPEDIEELIGTDKTVGKIYKVIAGYGQPVIASNGDVYTWKRTPDKYSILKWTWVDDPNVLTGPDAPSGLAVTPSINGLYLTWQASPNDPGCVTKYEVARSTTSGGVFSTIDTVEKGVLKYNDTTAEVGTTYYYKVRAMAGSDPSAYTAEVSGKR